MVAIKPDATPTPADTHRPPAHMPHAKILLRNYSTQAPKCIDATARVGRTAPAHSGNTSLGIHCRRGLNSIQFLSHLHESECDRAACSVPSLTRVPRTPGATFTHAHTRQAPALRHDEAHPCLCPRCRRLGQDLVQGVSDHPAPHTTCRRGGVAAALSSPRAPQCVRPVRPFVRAAC